MKQSLSAEEVANHFRQQTWCAQIIDAPGTIYGISSSRAERSEDSDRIQSQDQLIGTALNNENGVPNILVVFQDPDSPNTPPPAQRGEGLRFPIDSVSLLVDLRDNVRGFNGYVHGGFLGTIMDEVMGTLIFANYEYQSRKEAEADAEAERRGVESTGWAIPSGIVDMKVGGLTMTASMKVNFRRPVSTPSTILTTAKLNRLEGRKIFIDVDVRDETGAVCTTCDGMWVSQMPLATPPNAEAGTASSKL
ncbi:hypothetical protein SEUCBS139899_006105 [Sporothrix eucalyptigena]|uniref:Thioesterase domain-containing protein n=1 Tax=Sporothrix eucalyptigena TaxID=1812306 RepID=A0ABP0CAP8_9PEZI